MIYGYCRVSTKKQLEGFGMEQQKQEILSKYPTAIIVEEQFTGKTTDRPKFNELINKLEDKDVLVVSKLDRFARNRYDSAIYKTKLKANNVKVNHHFAPRRPGDIATCYSDPSKAGAMLNWKAQKSLVDMCRDAWRWQQNCDK